MPHQPQSVFKENHDAMKWFMDNKVLSLNEQSTPTAIKIRTDKAHKFYGSTPISTQERIVGVISMHERLNGGSWNGRVVLNVNTACRRLFD